MTTWLTEQQGRILVTVAGVALPTSTWSDFNPGANTGNGSQDYLGGMTPAVALPGVAKRGAMTVMRPWTDDLWAVFVALDNAVDEGMVTTVAFVPLIAAVAIGKPINYVGILDGVTLPGTTAGSGTAQKLSISILPNQKISQR